MVDTTIQFNGHNSYKVTAQVFCYPFGVQGMSYITHSFQAYATSMLSSATRAKTRFFNADGLVVGESSHAFAVTAVFGKIEITVTVPETAIQAQLFFLQAGTDWWIAEPKSEQGETATPYSVNYAGQLTYITPNGIYTGMMTTGQIVVTGSVANPDETLDTRLVTINNGVINLTATSNDHGTRLTQIEAGKITINGDTTFDSTAVIPGAQIDDASVSVAKLGTTIIDGGYLKTDLIATKAITGVKLADGTVTDVKIASGLSATKITAGKLQSVDGKTWFDLNKPEIVQTAIIGGKGVKVELSPTNPFKLSMVGNTHYQDYVYITGTSGFSGAGILVTSKYDINEDGVVDVNDVKLIFDYILHRDISPGVSWPAGYPTNRMDVNDDGTISSSDMNLVFKNATINDRLSDVGGNQLGVDSVGIWMSDDWGATKTYLHNF